MKRAATRQLVEALVLSLSSLATAACGDATPPPAAAASAEPSSGAELTGFEPRRGGMQVEGILGTIRPSRIEQALQEKLPQFQRCFFDGSADVEALAGAMQFYFHVGLDGSVEWVVPRQSSVGHRATELCLLSHAKRTKFPKPQGGGPAEFSWGFEFDAADASKAPVPWNAQAVASLLDQHRPDLDSCGVQASDRNVVTAYVAPGGSPVALGAAVSTPAGSERIDCVLEAIKTWTFPDPAPHIAKVSFPL